MVYSADTQYTQQIKVWMKNNKHGFTDSNFAMHIVHKHTTCTDNNIAVHVVCLHYISHAIFMDLFRLITGVSNPIM